MTSSNYAQNLTAADLHVTQMEANDNGDWQFPLMLSCLAGASTSVGAAIVFVISPGKIRQSMSFSLSLAASVMITVSVISIGPECLEGIVEFDSATGRLHVISSLLIERIVSFSLGCFGYYLLSRLLVALPEPESFVASTANSQSSPDSAAEMEDEEDEEQQMKQQQSNQDEKTPTTHSKATTQSSPKEHRGTVRRAITRDGSKKTRSTLSPKSSGESVDSQDDYSAASGDERKKLNTNSSANLSKGKRKQQHEERRRSWRVAILLFVSLLCHNFPEGLAVVASTAESRELGVTVAIGILIHNIPEGIAIAVPCMAARPDAPWLAFGLASVSGLAEPLGAMVALSVLQSTKDLPLENILACVAGIMCMVAVVELYPEAYRHVHQQNYVGMLWGTIVGMAIMITTEYYLP